MEMSRHARKRSRQRAIRWEMIEVALRYGHSRRSHGDRVFEVRDRSLVGTPFEKQADRLRGLTVVVAPEGSVRTVKWEYRLRRRPGVLGRHRRRQP